MKKKSKPILGKWELNDKIVNITVKDLWEKPWDLVSNKDLEEDIF